MLAIWLYEIFGSDTRPAFAFHPSLLSSKLPGDVRFMKPERFRSISGTNPPFASLANGCSQPDAHHAGPLGSAVDMLCIGIVSGVADTMSFNGLALKSLPLQSASLIRPFSICGNTTHGAEIQAFKNWAQAHPEQWTIRGSAGVILALAQLWPCS